MKELLTQPRLRLLPPSPSNHPSPSPLPLPLSRLGLGTHIHVPTRPTALNPPTLPFPPNIIPPTTPFHTLELTTVISYFLLTCRTNLDTSDS